MYGNLKKGLKSSALSCSDFTFSFDFLDVEQTRSVVWLILKVLSKNLCFDNAELWRQSKFKNSILIISIFGVVFIHKLLGNVHIIRYAISRDFLSGVSTFLVIKTILPGWLPNYLLYALYGRILSVGKPTTILFCSASIPEFTTPGMFKSKHNLIQIEQSSYKKHLQISFKK
jgi:hypothetical protein